MRRSSNVVELVYNLEGNDVDKLVDNPQQFIAQRNGKRAVEVNIRSLEGEELEEMEEAMAKELAEWLQEEALKVASKAEIQGFTDDRLLKMRWV